MVVNVGLRSFKDFCLSSQSSDRFLAGFLSQRFLAGFWCKGFCLSSQSSDRFLAGFWCIYAKNHPKFAGIGANQFKGTF